METTAFPTGLMEGLDEMKQTMQHFDTAKDRIVYRLIDARPAALERIKGQNLLIHTIPNTDIGIIYTVEMSDQADKRTVSCHILQSTLETWGVTADTIAKTAEQNTTRRHPVVLRHMCDVLTDTRPDAPDFLILSNAEGVHGSAAILYPGTKKALLSRFPYGLYILPSSVHELLLLDRSCAPPAFDLLKMVKDINATVLHPKDILADDVFTLTESGDLISAVNV